MIPAVEMMLQRIGRKRALQAWSGSGDAITRTVDAALEHIDTHTSYLGGQAGAVAFVEAVAARL